MGTPGENCRKSLVEAIEEKYKMDESAMDIQIFGLPKSSGGADEIIVPSHLVMDDAGVTHAGDLTTLARLCKNVCELDLEMNQLSDWGKVFEILNQVPKCSLLNLRMNPLPNFQCKEGENIPEFKNIVKLVLNHTPITLQSVCSLLQVFPCLHELYMSLNNYGTVEIETSQTFPTVKYVNFRSNSISDWTEIAKLGQLFPNLTNLVILDNPLENFPVVEEMCANFQKLTSINISETNIKTWTELEKFRYFPELTEMRVQDIPLLKEYTEEQRRYLLLAYLPKVKRLNGGSVREGEQEDAERAFIRFHMDLPEQHRPARYTELEAIHGKLNKLVNVDLKPEDTVTVELFVEDEGKSILRPISVHWTLMELRKFVYEEFGIEKRRKLRFVLTNVHHEIGEFLMRYPTRTMLRYNINDGDKITIIKC